MIRVPAELLDYKQWVLWRRVEVNGRATKIPISPWSGKAAACDKPQTWSAYRHVLYALRRFPRHGIGFVFTEADPFCGIDLDQCRAVDGAITLEALNLINRLASYTELSPSGTGAHVLVKAKLPGKGRRSGKIEMYDTGRYFTITGKHLLDMPIAVLNRQAVVEQLANELLPKTSAALSDAFATSLSLSDEELIERAKSARNGDRFRRLWEGDVSDYGNDHSRADLALCGILAFWCRGDTDRVDRLFRRSGLMRDKWDRRTGQTTYGVRTIKARAAWAMEEFLDCGSLLVLRSMPGNRYAHRVWSIEGATTRLKLSSIPHCSDKNRRPSRMATTPGRLKYRLRMS